MGWFKRTSEASSQASTPERRRLSFSGAMHRMLDAARTDRLTNSWLTMPLTADDVVRRNQRTCVARSREQAANNDYGRAFVRSCVRNIVGPAGIQLQAQVSLRTGKLDTTANDAIEAAWRQWSMPDNCDVTGKRSLRAIQAACIRSCATDGEYMINIVTGSDAGPWGFSLQLLDPQRCPIDFDQELSNGRFIRHGIEFNRYGRPLAYYFTTTDAITSDYSYGGKAYQRIPAESIIHGFDPDMVGQKRGLPWMSTALWRLKMLGEFEKASLTNARVSSSKAGFFEWDPDTGPETDSDEPLYIDVEAGMFQELPAGVRFKEWNPQYPAGEFGQFHKAMLRGIASGLGVAYNNLANDLEGVNFSSIRQGTLDEREHWKEMQTWLVETLLARLYREWLPRALLAGRITSGGTAIAASRLADLQAVTWQPRRWSWVDPRADVQAATDSKNQLLASPGQLIREQGRDPDATWREIARDIESMKAAGIPEQFIAAAMGIKPAAPGEPPNEQKENG